MIPYIAALILLIVVILYQVYAKTDGFTQDASGNVVVDASGNDLDASGNDIVDASGNSMTGKPVFPVDASGNPLFTSDLSNKQMSENEMKLSLSDLFGLLGPFKMDASGNPVVTNTASTSGTTITAPAPAATPASGLSAQEITDRIAKAVSKQVKDDLISQHSLDNIHDKYAPCDLTNAEAQGQEYGSKQQQQPLSQPDMSEYIRKDSIPCWNCAVP